MQSNFIKEVVSCVIKMKKKSATRGTRIKQSKIFHMPTSYIDDIAMKIVFPLPLELLGKIGHIPETPLHSSSFAT